MTLLASALLVCSKGDREIAAAVYAAAVQARLDHALALAAIDAVPLHPADTTYWAKMLERTGLASEELTDQEWQFAAACDPETILALLGELATERAKAEAQVAALGKP